jgi:anaerobic selenocysteine-containing dehydrogenase
MTLAVYNSERGLVFQESYDESWMKFLEQRGWRYPAYFSFDEFWTDLVNKGGWWEPHFQNEQVSFNTPSKKFEFYSQNLKIKNISGANDEWFLPHYSPRLQHNNENDYSFHLNPYLLATLGSGGGNYQPTMLEILSIHVKHRWSSWVEINHEDADRLGLKNKDWVWLVSSKGKIKTQVHIFPAALPGIVSAPLGLRRTYWEQLAEINDPNLLSIILPNFDVITGQTAFLETTINLIKI